MKKIKTTMSASGGDGSCKRCGRGVEMLTHRGHSLMPIHCVECLDVVRAEARSKRRAERLSAWAKRSGFPTAQLGDALRSGARSHQVMGLIGQDGVYGCYMHGETGTGKTTSALAYVYERASERLSADVESGLPMVRYMTEERAFSRLSAAGHEDAVDEILSCTVLVLDEVGACQGSARARARYADALMRRFADRKTVIMVSNLSIKALYASPSAPVWDVRMIERVLLMSGGGAVVVEMTEPFRNREMRRAQGRVEQMLANLGGGGRS